MPDIFHDFPIKASPARVFEAISAPHGLDAWWTKKSSGRPAEAEEYKLWFGPHFDWRALVTKCVAPSEFELEILARTRTGRVPVSAFVFTASKQRTCASITPAGPWPTNTGESHATAGRCILGFFGAISSMASPCHIK